MHNRVGGERPHSLRVSARRPKTSAHREMKESCVAQSSPIQASTRARKQNRHHTAERLPNPCSNAPTVSLCLSLAASSASPRAQSSLWPSLLSTAQLHATPAWQRQPRANAEPKSFWRQPAMCNGTKQQAAAASVAAAAPFPFDVPRVDISISIRPGTTHVTSEVTYVPLADLDASSTQQQQQQQQLQLRCEDLELLQLSLDGEPLAASVYTFNAAACSLTVWQVPRRAFVLTTLTAIHPEQHSDLEGMFCVGGVYATQCEAAQFSMLTPFPDRPDVLSSWRVRLEAESAACPVLLSNGSLTEAGQLPEGRHFAVWEDPVPKPCYLFSAVAGDLALREDSHTSRSTGRVVALRTYVPPAYADQLDVAVTAIKAAMVWDEAAFGREYDLDAYTMVGLAGFNDDATEAAGMALFSINVLAARPEANTDDEVDSITRLVAHEFFHHWSGNRVTLCDWLNLTVKEGLTVYREQQFMADLDAAAAAVTAPPGSSDWEAALLDALHAHTLAAGEGAGASHGQLQEASWKRAQDAAYLRSEQFPEDAGPLAHAIRPAAVSSLSNLYTDTVYAKGAAVVRMFKSLLGPAAFKRGVEAFFDSNQGKAVACEAFCEALCGAAHPGAADLLPGMLAWYATPGTPTLSISSSYSPSSQSLTLTVKQSNTKAAGQLGKAGNRPRLIPLKVGLVGSDGQDLPLRLKAASSSSKSKGGKATSSSMTAEGVAYSAGLAGSISTSVVLLVDSSSKSFTFTHLPDKPCISLLRDFSAPVQLEVEGETDKQLGFLAQHDSNAFARWDALQRLLTRLISRLYERAEAHAEQVQDMASLAALLSAAGGPPPALLAALQAVLADDSLDGEYRASMLQLPSLTEVASQLHEPDPELLWMVWVRVGQQLASSLRLQLEQVITQCDASQQLSPGFEPRAVKLRALRNAALGLRSFDWSEQLQQQLLDRYYGAANMTDRLAALELLADEDTPARAAALAHFHDAFCGQPLAMLKWLHVQAACDLDGNVGRVAALMEHPAFDIASPSGCEHLLFGFAASVPNFHAEDGSGYEFMAGAILKVDSVNPQMAARLAVTLADGDTWDEDRQALMSAQLGRLGGPGVSGDLRATVARALGEGCC